MLNMESGSKLQRRLLIGTAVVLVSGVFAFLTYRDYRLIQTIRDEIQSTEGAIHAARAKISKIPAQEHDVIVRRENLNEYVQILPDDREINDFVSKINSFADRSGVEVSKLDDVGARNRAPVKGPKDPFEKVVYKMDLRGSTESILAFLNSFESYERFVKVSMIDLRAGKAHADTRGEAIHEANLELETYVYNAGGGIQPVPIEGYEEKRTALADAIMSSRDDIEILRYELSTSPRRDPMADPRVAADAELAASLVPAEEQERTLSRLADEVNEILAQIDLETSDVSTLGVVERAELKRQINERLTLLQEAVAGLTERDYFSGTVKTRFDTAVVGPVARLLNERNIVGGAVLTLDELDRVRNTMRDLLARGQHSDVLATYGQVESRFHFVTGSEEGVELINVIDQIRNEASAVMEFTDRNVKVSGVIVRPNNGSVAVVNGKVLGVGDTLDGDILVTSIDVDRVEFNFKSVSIRRSVE